MPGPLQKADAQKCSRSSAGQVSRPLSDGVEPHMAAVHPVSHGKQVASRGGCSGITACVSPSPRAASLDLTACCPPPLWVWRVQIHHPTSMLLPAPRTRHGPWISGSQIHDPGGKPAACAVPATARGTAGRSSRPQLCDTPQAPMAGPAAGWLHAKVTQSLGGQRGVAPPAPRQLSFAVLCPSTGLAQLFPPMHQLHPSSSGPPKEQPVWVLGVFLPAGQLHSLAQGAGWCGLVGYLQEAFLTPGFSYGGLLNFQLYSHCLGISTLQLGQGPVTQSPSSGVGQEGCSRNGLRG